MEPLSLAISPETLERSALVLARVSGLMMVAPIFARNDIPKLARVVLTLGLSVLLYPSARESGMIEGAGITAAHYLSEMALGVAMGMVVEFLFAGIDLASAVVAFGTGLSYVNTIDPNSSLRGTALANFQWFMVSLLFLTVDGHHMLLDALALSFQAAPAGSVQVATLGAAVMSASTLMFVLGLTLAAPTLVVLMLVDISLGLAGRVAPQLQSLILGMGLKPMAGFFSMALVYGSMPQVFSRFMAATALNVGRVIAAAAG